MFAVLTKNWWVFALRGLLAILFGVLALIWPEITILSLVILFGVFVLLEGILNLVIGIASSGTNQRWWLALLEGLVGVGIALLTFFWPNVTAVALLYFIAAWALISGVMEIFTAIRVRKMIDNEWAMILNGILSIVFGILLFVFPGESAISLIWLIGIFAIVIGILLFVLAFRLRQHRHENQMAA